MTQNSLNTKQPLIQAVYTVLTDTVTINSAIPNDNTIPQNTEGVEVMTCSITPTNANNLLIIKANVYGINGGVSTVLMTALFQDATANALAAQQSNVGVSAGWPVMGTVCYAKVAGTTSATTFKIRCGRTGGYIDVNPATFGGVQTSYMEVWEIKA